MRIGTGYDVHKLVENRRLILGGVEINHEKGLLGHSDADVVVHAIIDCLLGSICKGDIGSNFPDTSGEFKNISSIELLKRVSEIIKLEGYTIGNIDTTIIAQKPKLAPYISDMRKNIANALCVDESKISVKAKTEEGLGFTGECLGIAAQAVCLLEEIK